jgi:MFS family permease
MPETTDAKIRAKRNLKFFICFRMFFNARFYYPVYAIFFLRHGLTWEDFGILNGIWAITIILLEVPSGALADNTIGRKKLLVFAGVCMIIEMLTLLSAPMDGSAWVFGLFAINRIISGMAEAAASGADEALVYDSLKEAGMEKEWSNALVKTQRYTSLAFFFAMMTGSAFYDADFLNTCLHNLGFSFSLSAETMIKAPIFLTLLSSLVVLGAALGLRENFRGSNDTPMEAIRTSLVETKEAGLWIWSTALPFGILMAAMVLDSIIRQFLTVASAYWSVIKYPLWTFGLIASGMSLMGFFVPVFARYLTKRNSPGFNFLLISAILTLGLFGIGYAFPLWGILPAALLWACMQCMGFLVSCYLNEEASSEQRATVLSFRGLSTNLSYGVVCFLFSGLIAWINPDEGQEIKIGAEMTEQESSVFVQALGWFPWYFLVTLALILFIYRFRFGKKLA